MTSYAEDEKAVLKWLEILEECLGDERAIPARMSAEETEAYFDNRGLFNDAIGVDDTRWSDLPAGFRTRVLIRYLIRVGYFESIDDYFDDGRVQMEYTNPLDGTDEESPGSGEIYAIIEPPDEAFGMNGLDWCTLEAGKQYEFYAQHVLLRVDVGMDPSEAAYHLRRLANKLDAEEHISRYDGCF